MLFITVGFVIIEFLVFLLLVIGAFALGHLGLLIVGRIDAYLSPAVREFGRCRLSSRGAKPERQIKKEE